MSTSKRIYGIAYPTLTVLFVSVFFMSQSVYAYNGDAPRPLSVNDQIIAKQTAIIESKSASIAASQSKKTELDAKVVSLNSQITTDNKRIEELKQKIEQKRIAAEAEKKRVEELKNMFVKVNRYASDSSGNAYAAGNCTWYVKSRRPDIGNYWGDARNWYANAASQGWSVGSKPKKGAIATTTAGSWGHVAYVDGVSLDGLFVTISEMNYGGLYNMNTRTVPFTDFQYIYELD